MGLLLLRPCCATSGFTCTKRKRLGRVESSGCAIFKPEEGSAAVGWAISRLIEGAGGFGSSLLRPGGGAGWFGSALVGPGEEPYFFSSRAGEGSTAESVEFLPRDFLLPVVCVHPRICVGPWDGGGAVAE